MSAHCCRASRRPRGRRVGILTNAGGLGILCADVCDAVGLELPEPADETRGQLAALLSAEASLANPVDMLGGATADTYGKALAAMLGDPHLDALIVLFVPTVTASADDVAHAIDRVVAESDAGKPVLAVVMTASGIPQPLRRGRGRVASFAYPESAARALGRAAERAEWLRRPHGTVPTVSGIDRQAAENIVESALSRGDDVWLEAAEARALLLAYGLPLVPERIAGSAARPRRPLASSDSRSSSRPRSPGHTRPTSAGSPSTSADEAAVHAAVERIGAPVLVQPMVKGSAELLAGIVQDPVFGPLVAFGPGGVLAELIGEAGFRIAPLTDHDAEELVLGGKSGRLVRGFRGAPAADSRALVDLVHRLARLGEDLDAVKELDLNPVIAQVDGCVVVDSRVRVQRQERQARLKSW